MTDQMNFSEPIGDVIVRNIKSETVKAKTGKCWDEWYVALDEAAPDNYDLDQLIEHIGRMYGMSEWWSSIIANRYQWIRGLRK